VILGDAPVPVQFPVLPSLRIAEKHDAIVHELMNGSRGQVFTTAALEEIPAANERLTDAKRPKKDKKRVQLSKSG
jgi:hypothetical protein